MSEADREAVTQALVVSYFDLRDIKENPDWHWDCQKDEVADTDSCRYGLTRSPGVACVHVDSSGRAYTRKQQIQRERCSSCGIRRFWHSVDLSLNPWPGQPILS